MSCKLMLCIERIVKDIERQYAIKLDSQYIELLKRPLCSEVCDGKCRNEYYKQKNKNLIYPYAKNTFSFMRRP